MASHLEASNLRKNRDLARGKSLEVGDKTLAGDKTLTGDKTAEVDDKARAHTLRDDEASLCIHHQLYRRHCFCNHRYQYIH